jgi:hypothetical protein
MTWFRAFDKTSWELRFWRKTNLRFNQDEYGMARIKYVSWFKDMCLRFSRCDAAQRFCNLILLTSGIFIMLDFKDKVLDDVVYKPKREKASLDMLESNKKAQDTLFYNRFNANSRPLRSIDNFINFLMSPEAIENVTDFIGAPEAATATDDIMNGLDTWMSDEDKKMIQYYKRNRARDTH